MKIAKVENSSLAVFDTDKKHYILSCSKFDKTIGYQLNLDRKAGPEYFYSIMHPSDFPFVIDTVCRTYKFLNGLPPLERTEYKLIVDYRLRSKSGFYFRFVQQMVVLELDKNGEIWLLLKLFDLVSDKAGDEPSQRKLINIKTWQLHLFNEDNDNTSDKILTNREIQVLDLISQGLDSKDISERLFISLNTVNNHRQNILNKTGAGNTSQALLYAKRIGIL
ncbi:MAG TPA: response regulator transcription factor [Bacteroidales bacterium]|nr:response regulator transcription factor [Bacteroidales bacterium]